MRGWKDFSLPRFLQGVVLAYIKKCGFLELIKNRGYDNSKSESAIYFTYHVGRKISVVLPINDFKSIMEQLKELEDVRLYDEAKKSKELSIPIDKAFEMIEAKRK